LKIVLAFLLGMVVQTVGMVQAAETVASETILAWVNKGTETQETVTLEAFKEAAARKSPENGESLSLTEKQEVLQHLIEEAVLYQEALKLGYDKDPKVKKVMVNTLLREEVFNQVKNSDFSDEELQAYYNSHREEFIVPEKRQIKRILIKITAERDSDAALSAIQEAQRRILNGEEFKDVAAQLSEDPYKRRGGDIGFVAREGKSGLDQAIVDKAWTLQQDVLSEPFLTEDGWNLIIVTSMREQVERTYQQMKGSVLRKVKNDKMKALYDAYVGILLAKARVTIDQQLLQSIEIKSARSTFSPGLMPGEIEDTGE
jgi:hypothetical protein